MSAPTPVHDVTIRRAPESAPLITAADLPPARLFINGEFTDASSDDVLDVVDPSSEIVITAIPNGTREDVDRAVAAAVAAAPAWARLVPRTRSETLHRIADRIADNAELLVRLESAEHR